MQFKIAHIAHTWRKNRRSCSSQIDAAVRDSTVVDRLLIGDAGSDGTVAARVRSSEPGQKVGAGVECFCGGGVREPALDASLWASELDGVRYPLPDAAVDWAVDTGISGEKMYAFEWIDRGMSPDS
jgi:hypothetical protein